MKFTINRGITSGCYRVLPMDLEMINSFLEGEGNTEPLLDDFKTRLSEMKELLDSKDFNYFFNTLWVIYHHPKDAGEEELGWAYFHGNPLLGSLELTIYIKPEFRDRDHATSAIKILSEWALNQNTVYDIKAFIDHENSAAIHAFSNAGYFYKEIVNNIEEYSITKEPTAWLSLYILIGIWGGWAIGVLIDMLWVGLGIGVLTGIIIGGIMDGKAKEQRNKVRGTTMKKQKRKSK